MDRKHVFADKLELVTGFVFYKTGVIASTSPDIWYLEDTNGDEVADKRTKLYTGLGTFDTHAVINNLRWGLDGWIYATHGYSVGAVTSPDGTKSFGRDGSGVVRFKPDGSAFEQYSSRGGNTWGLDITWDGQVFWTQPTSGTVFFHTVLPESVLAKGKLPATTSWKGMIAGQTTYPRMSRPEQAYVQIDQVGQFTAAAGCAIYDGGAWPAKWRYSYFTGEPTLNIVHHEFVKPDGVSYTTEKEAGREQTEFMRSGDMWFRPDRDARRSRRRALRRRLLQPGRDPQRHARTAARSGQRRRPARPRPLLRPDLARAAQAGDQARRAPALNRTDLAGLIRAIETSPNAHVRQTAWRLAQENHASDARLAKIKKPMGSSVLALYERARGATTAAERKAMLDTFAKATDTWTQSAIVAAATEQVPKLCRERARLRASAGADRARRRHHARRRAGQCRPVARLGRRRRPSERRRSRPRVVRGDRPDGRRNDRHGRGDDRGAAEAARRSGDDRGGAADRREVGQGGRVQRQRRALRTRARRRARRREDERRSPRRARGEPPRRSPASSRSAETQSRRCSPTQDVSDALKGRIITTLGESAGSDVDAVMVAAFARTSSTLLFDQILRRPDASVALLAALEGRHGHARDARTGQRRAVARASEPAGGAAGGRAPRYAQPGGEGEERDHRRAHAGNREARRCREGEGALHRHVSSCHKLGALGKSEVGPPLNGMGAHGRAGTPEPHHRPEPRGRPELLAVERDDEEG